MENSTIEAERTTEIRNQMNEIRCQLGDEVEEFVDSARTLTDWKHYVRRHPWACMAGAAAIGFWVVPKRVRIISPSGKSLEKLVKRSCKDCQNGDSSGSTPSSHGLRGAIFGMLANAAMRSAVAYVGQNAGRLLGEHTNLGGDHAEPDL